MGAVIKSDEERSAKKTQCLCVLTDCFADTKKGLCMGLFLRNVH
jgi:hypothetical protein